MAVSSIPPLSLAATFPPLRSVQPVTLQDGPQSFVPPVPRGPPAPTYAVPPAATGRQLLASLEQALFRDLLGNAQPGDLTSIAPDIMQMVTAQLGAPTGIAADLVPPPLQAGTATSMLLSSSVASLFEVIQLLGGATGEERGSLLDVLA